MNQEQQDISGFVPFPDFIVDGPDTLPEDRGTPLSRTGYALACALRDELQAGGAQPEQFTAQADALVAIDDLIAEYESTQVVTEAIVTMRCVFKG